MRKRCGLLFQRQPHWLLNGGENVLSKFQSGSTQPAVIPHPYDRQVHIEMLPKRCEILEGLYRQLLPGGHAFKSGFSLAIANIHIFLPIKKKSDIYPHIIKKEFYTTCIHQLPTLSLLVLSCFDNPKASRLLYSSVRSSSRVE